MNGDKQKFSPPMVGGSSLLVIFAILCLTIFALLSLSTVQADERLGKAAADAVVGYYDADRNAELILARLRHGDVPDTVKLTETEVGVTAEYACRISDTQTLYVTVNFNGALGDEYTVTRWQAVSTALWQPDDDIKVWDGES